MNISEFLEQNKRFVLIGSLLSIVFVIAMITSSFRPSTPKINVDQETINRTMQKTIDSQRRTGSSQSLQTINNSIPTALFTTDNTKMLIDEKGFIIAIGLGGLLLIILFPIVLFKRR